MIRIRPALCVFAVLACLPDVASAGMPRATAVLEELPRLRLQSISFFLAGFLLSSLLIQLLWNALHKDFPILPRLSYLRAVGLVALWGLLFVLVLTMISGARELLTPGAWKPEGVGYRLANEELAPGAEARREQLLRLKEELWRYARAHKGRFPASKADTAIPAGRWDLPDASGQQYFYRSGTATPFDGVPWRGSRRSTAASDGCCSATATCGC